MLPEIVTAVPGPKSIALADRLSRVESPAFDARRDAREKTSGASQAPIVYARGKGANVWDVDGNRYVDLTAGFGALALGHDAPEISNAVRAQMDALVLALGDVYSADVKIELCERLAKIFPEPGARVMLGLSGADAVTAAMKTAMLHTKRARVIAFEGAYHGLSYAPLAACGLNDAFRAPFAAQLGDHVTFVPYGSVPDLTDVGAVLVEPILGRGGCVVPPTDFLPELRRACDRHGALLIADEIWTGLGRSGSMIASTVVPDLLCLGKALGGGYPISACIGRAHVMEEWRGTIHTATHFGWPLACRAALAVLDTIEKKDLCARAREKFSLVPNARGRGLMLGIPCSSAAHALRTSRKLLERGWIVLTGGSDGATLTLTPPLDIEESLLVAFSKTLQECS